MNVRASGLIVRFLSVTMPTRRYVVGSSTASVLTDGYLSGSLMIAAATTAKKGPVSATIGGTKSADVGVSHYCDITGRPARVRFVG